MKCAKALCTLSLSHEFLTHRLISPVHSVFVYDINCQIILAMQCTLSNVRNQNMVFSKL
jgi:hypothetical protein